MLNILINVHVIFAKLLIAKWLKTFLEKFESAIGSINYILTNESEFENYKRSIRSEVFNHKDIALILILFLLIKLINVLNPYETWKGGGSIGYVFPLTAIWWGFSIYIIYWFVFMTYTSAAYVYSRVTFALKNQRLNLFLFHPDGNAGLGKISDFILSTLTVIFLIISLLTFSLFLSLHLQTEPIYSQKGLIAITILGDSFALIILLNPLMEMRSIIKRKKEEERKLLLERIKQKEEVYLKGSLNDKEFQELENTFQLIKHIDAVPEWGMGSRQWLSLIGKVLLTFNGVALQILTKYVVIQ